MYYLAYGSNLHPVRLAGRTPNARLIGTSELSGYRLTFHKRSVDGSAKCNLLHTGDPEDVTFAAVYRVPESEVHALDRAEGLGNGYDKQQLQVIVDGESVTVFTYVANDTHLVFDLEPYHWYKDLVLAGARYHGFPTHYTEAIAAVRSRRDTHEERSAKNERLLIRLQH